MSVECEVRIYRGWKLSYEKVTSIFTKEQIEELKDNDYLFSMDTWQADENADWILGIPVYFTPYGTAKVLEVEEIYEKYDKEQEMIKFVYDMVPKEKNYFLNPHYILGHRVW